MIEHTFLRRPYVSASLICSVFSPLLLVADICHRGFGRNRFLAVL
jgi:hypothetical protein